MWTSFPPGPGDPRRPGGGVARGSCALFRSPGKVVYLSVLAPSALLWSPRVRREGTLPGGGGEGGWRSPGRLPRAPCSGVGTEAPRALPAVLREAGEAWGFSEPRLWVRLLVARPRLAQISLQVHTQRGQWLTHTFQLRDFQEAASGWARNLGVGRSAGGLCTPTAEPGFLLCSLY